MRTPSFVHRLRPTAIFASALVVLLAGCRDGDESTAPEAQPVGFQITLPDTVLAGVPFELTVLAVGDDGSIPATEVTGPVSLSASGGTVSPAALTLIGGVGTGQVTLSDVTGPQTFTVSRNTAAESVDLLVIGREPVARVEVIPGSVLLTDAGESRQLTARAYDAEGWPTQAEFTWTSQDPAVAAVDAGGLLTSGDRVGSSQVVATAQGVSAPTVLAVSARPVAGALLIDDAQVARAAADGAPSARSQVGASLPVASSEYQMSAVDPDAEYGLGYQYRVTLTDVEAPAPGAIMIGTGDAPVAGRVVSSSTGTEGVAVVLEVVPVAEVFQELVLEQEFDLDASDLVYTDEVAALYQARPLDDGSVELRARTPDPSTAGSLGTPPIAAQFIPNSSRVGPFKCTAKFLGAPIQIRNTPSVTVRPTFTSKIGYQRADGLKEYSVEGAVTVDIDFDFVFALRTEQEFNCKIQLGVIPIPVGGPLSIFLGAKVPVGAGFELKRTTTFTDLSGTVSGSGGGSVKIGALCSAGDCDWFGDVDGNWGLSFETEFPTSLQSQFSVATRAHGYAYAVLGMGPSAPFFPTLEVVEARTGVAQEFDLSTTEIQTENASYGSSFKFGFLGIAKPGSGITRALEVLGGRVAAKPELKIYAPLAESPKGQITVSAPRIRAGNSTIPGDTVEFTVLLDPITYLSLPSVGAVELKWLRDDGNGGKTLQDAPGACTRIPAGLGQTEFKCSLTFTEAEVGTHQFFAFTDATAFGLPVPGLIEAGSDAQVQLIVDPPTPQVDVAPSWSLIIPSGGAKQFTATVTGLTDPAVTWSVEPAPVMGTIDADGRYVSPSLPTGQAIANVIRATSVEDPQIFGRAVVHVSEPRVNPRDPSAGGCVPSAGSECSGEGSSWGDPHLVTPDDLKYDFMAVGDFVLTRSTAAGDGLEVHTRYRRPDGDEEFSWNKAVAMRVEDDVVELHAGAPGLIDIVVNGQDVTVPVDGSMELDGGGVISRAPLYVTVSWPDRTQVEVAPSGVDGVLAYVRTSLPSSRYGQVEGLLGNFDGDPDNDIRIRGGAVLTDPTPLELYTTYRESWWVPFGTEESLFSRGTEQFDPSFPPRAVSVFDLDTEDVIRASQVCLDAGVLDGEILNACILDVVLTGDDRWAAVAAGMDPNALAIKISPSAAYVQQGDSRQFGAILTGIADRRVQWATTGGTIQVDGDNIMTYTAPDQVGEYTITATSIADGSLVASATVYVSEAATGFSKEWTGQVDGEWVNADNWMPAGEPDSTDNVYIPAGTPNPLYLRWSNKKVNNLAVEDGGSSGGAVPLVVRGNAVVESPLDIIMTGSNKTVRGNVPLLRVQGVISPGGPLEVGRFYLDGGTFSPDGHTVNVRETLQSYAETGGRLVMNRPDDHLVVDGNVGFFRLSSGLGSLTAGTLEVRGNLEMADGSVQFIPSGTHRVLMNGTEAQYIRVRWGYVRGNEQPPTNRVFNDLELANPAGVYVGDKAVQVNGAITVTAGSVSGVSVHLFGGLEDPAGGWAVPLVIRDPGVALPAHLRANLTLAGGEFGVDYTPGAELTVTGAVEVRTGSTLRVGPRTVTVNGSLTTAGNGNVVMGDATGRLVVNGDALFGEGATVSATAGALFSAGRFEITGNLTERINRYRASGTHVTAFTGATAQTASVSCHYSNCTAYNASAPVVFHGIEVTNPAGVTFQGGTMGVGGEVRVLTGGATVFDQNVRLDRSLDVAGGLTLPAGRTLVVTESLILRSSGVLTNNGDLSAASCTKEEGHTINGTDPCG